MANDTELERKQLQVFCGGAGEQQTSVFGTMKNPDPDYSKDPETLQGTNWPQGWQNAIAADDAPFMEDMNSLFYVLSYMVKYLYQHGIPEWSNKETYTASKSVVLRNGKFYLAKQTTGADNPKDPATDSSNTYWYMALDPVNPAADQNWVKGYAQSLANLSQTLDSSTSKYPSNKAVQTGLSKVFDYLPLKVISQTSGTVSLENNKVHTMSITGNTTFTLPNPTNKSIFNQIKIMAKITGTPTITWGTDQFFNKAIPEIEAGNFDFYFDYDNNLSKWVCGAIIKGVAS